MAKETPEERTKAQFESRYVDRTGHNVRMDPAVKAQWLADLRSGKYKQGKEKLRKLLGMSATALDDAACTNGEAHSDKLRHCCLGVLSEQFVAAGKATWKMNTPGTFSIVGENGRSSEAMPTSYIYGLAGISLDRGDIIYVDWEDAKKFPESSGRFTGEVSLATLNDKGKKFSTIAKLIEKYL